MFKINHSAAIFTLSFLMFVVYIYLSYACFMAEQYFLTAACFGVLFILADIAQYHAFKLADEA